MISMGWRLHMKFIIKFGLFLSVSFLLVQQESLAAQKQQTETQKAATQGMKLDTGKEIFEAACIGCHGPGGRGQLDSIVGFEKPANVPGLLRLQWKHSRKNIRLAGDNSRRRPSARFFRNHAILVRSTESGANRKSHPVSSQPLHRTRLAAG